MVMKNHFIQSFANSPIQGVHRWIGTILLMFLSLGLATAGLGAEIVVKGQDGIVEEIGIFTTDLRSPDNKKIINFKFL